MTLPTDISPEQWQETGAFATCSTLAEVLVAVRALFGDAGVVKILGQTESTRENLREAADELHLVGLRDVAAIVRRHARRARPGPMTFEKRWARRRPAPL